MAELSDIPASPAPLSPEQIATLELDQLLAVCRLCMGCGKKGGCPGCGRVHRITMEDELRMERAKDRRRFRQARLEAH